MMNTLALETQLAKLRAIYAAQLPTRLAQLRAAIDSVCTQPENAQARQPLRHMAHRLAGSGGAMGLPKLSAAAFALMHVLDAAPAGALNETIIFQLRSYAAAMDACVGNSPELLSLPGAIRPDAIQEAARRMPQVAVVVSASADLAGLDVQLRHFGYHAVYCRIDDLQADSLNYSAIIIELDELLHSRALSARHIQLPTIPIISMAARSDMIARLQALRLGVASLLPYPFDIALLVETLDRVTMRLPNDPPRVLIVDDSPTSAHLHKAMLDAAGMITDLVLDPMLALQPLADFAPDLLLVDLYMPGCTGLELAAVVRQQAAYISLPIVFLSGETDRAIQLTALADVGDDFLTKPVVGQQLVTAIISRVTRARALRAQISRDGLTGLLNHATIIAQLAQEIERAQRLQTPLSVALLDIDHFKHVNDSYGHPAGDRVLKSLARALQQRLRASDGIGRYGGEEFLIIMPGTEAKSAQRVLDEVRERFAQLWHHDGIDRWATTFSGGVTSGARSIGKLISDADAALYAAKRQGRNRIVCGDRNEETN